MAALPVLALFVLAAWSQDPASDPLSRQVQLGDQGRELRAGGDLAGALHAFQEARHLAEEREDFPSAIVLDSEIALTHEAAGRIEAQLAVYRAIQGALEDHDRDPVFVAAVAVQCRADAALTLVRLGRTTEAIGEARTAVACAPRTHDPESRARGWNALGTALRAAGRLAEASTCLRRAAEEVAHLDPGTAPRADMQLNLAECLGELGSRSEARALVEEVVARIEALGAVEPALGARAFVVRGTMSFYEDWRGAESDLRVATRMLATTKPEGDPTRLQAGLYLAHAVRNGGRPAESAAMERAILAQASEELGSEHALATLARKFLAGSLWDLGAASGERAHLVEARALYEEAATRSRVARAADAYTAYAALGALLLDGFDDPTAAEPWMRAAVEEIEATSARALAIDEAARAGLFRQQRLHKRHDPYEGWLRCLVRLDRGEEALRVLELSRARGLADLLERSRFDALAEALQRAEEAGDEAAAARMRELPGELERALADAAAARTGASGADPRLADALARVSALCAERAELTQSVTEAGAPADVGTIRRALRDDEALLAYFLGRRASFACLAEGPAGDVRWYALTTADGRPLVSDDVAPAVEALLRSISSPGAGPARGVAGIPAREDAESASARSQALFPGLVPEELWVRLRGRALVHVLPHGALNRLPLEALVTRPAAGAEPARYWLDEGPALAYHESGSALVWSARRREAQRREPAVTDALVIADPDYAAEPLARTDAQAGAIVARVRRGGRGARAGLLAGDAVRSLAGAAVADASGFERALRAARGPSELVVLRRGAEVRMRLEPGDPEVELAGAAGLEIAPVATELAREPLARLAGTAREAQAVAEALEARTGSGDTRPGRVRVFTGDDATETLLTAWAPRSGIVHVAAHQVEDGYGRWAAGRLALAPPPFPTAEDDGFLDLDELLLHWRRRLERCQLVVLSSCRSRAGRLESDEGFYALPLGFRFAGCPTVVASLWPVDDEATSELMAAFYRALGQSDGDDRLAAFTAARRALRAARPDPFHWAAFVWTGAPR